MHLLALLLALTVAAVGLAADKPAVVDLFEDDAEGFIPKLTQGGIGGFEDVRVAAENDDVFSGKHALRVAPAQRFSPDIKGWAFQISENPKAGEYRYLRFAWKKQKPGPIMLQICTREPNDWNIRYHAGGNPPWPAKELGDKSPNEWALHTRDLFKDFQAYKLGGIAFSPLEGGDGLFDHILLGRTIEDLDKATLAALSKADSKALNEARLRTCFESLGSVDDSIGDAAHWILFAGRKEAVPFLAKNLRIPKREALKPIEPEVGNRLVEGLSHFRELNREAAFAEAVKLGESVATHVRKAAESAEGDVKARLTAFLERWQNQSAGEEIRLQRCAKLLKAIATSESKALADKIDAARK